MALNPAPFLFCRKELMKIKEFIGKWLCQEECFVSNPSPQMFKYCTEIILSGKHGRIFYYFRLLNASLAPYFWRLFHSWLQAAQVKLHLWVSQLQSVYFCIWRKVDGFEGAGRFGAKQTARVSILKVNITLCLNYTPSALQFSHTLALSPLWVLFLLTPPFSWPS